MNSLAGTFLISTNSMPDPRFAKQVLYICAHNDDGAMAIVINKPNLILSMDDIMVSMNLTVPAVKLPSVYMGGPMEVESAYFLYDSDYKVKHQLSVSNTVSLSREGAILEAISKEKGPDKYLFVLGYAGWGPGQLEHELLADGWLSLPANDEILFNTPDQDKWKQAALSSGIDISLYDDSNLGRTN